VLTTMGTLLASRSLATTAAGDQQLLGWAQTLGTPRRAGVECTGSYGAALTRHLRAAGVQVIEVNQPDKATRRRRGKTDAIDAEAAARAVLAGHATTTPKTGDGPWRWPGCSSWPRIPQSSPAPRPSTNSRPCWCPPTQRSASRCRGYPPPSSSADALRWTPVAVGPLMPPAPQPGPCGCWHAGSSASPPKSTTSKCGSPAPSTGPLHGSWNATVSVPHRS
jgi:hypothetical protein